MLSPSQEIPSRVLELRAQAISTSDLASIERFREFTRIGGVVMRTPKAHRKLLLDRDAGPTVRFTAAELRKVLVENLSIILGAPISRGAREFLEFRTNVGD